MELKASKIIPVKGKKFTTSTSGHCNIPRDLVGRNLHVVVSDPESFYWMLGENQLNDLLEQALDLSFEGPYAEEKARQIATSVDRVGANKDNMNKEDFCLIVYSVLKYSKANTDLAEKVKDLYQI
jgi:hypothetical protein